MLRAALHQFSGKVDLLEFKFNSSDLALKGQGNDQQR